MWKSRRVNGDKFVRDENNLRPLLSGLNPDSKIVIPTIGGDVKVTFKDPKKSSMKGKSIQSLAKVNWCKLKKFTIVNRVKTADLNNSSKTMSLQTNSSSLVFQRYLIIICLLT